MIWDMITFRYSICEIYQFVNNNLLYKSFDEWQLCFSMGYEFLVLYVFVHSAYSWHWSIDWCIWRSSSAENVTISHFNHERLKGNRFSCIVISTTKNLFTQRCTQSTIDYAATELRMHSFDGHKLTNAAMVNTNWDIKIRRYWNDWINQLNDCMRQSIYKFIFHSQIDRNRRKKWMY